MVLLFDPPINTQDELSVVYQAIRSEYPTVTWISGTPLERFDPLEILSTYDSNGVYVIYFHPGQISISWSPYKGEYNIEKEKDDPYTYDGRQWVIDRLMGGVSTDDLFNQLNESIESGDYIIYEFDEPIDNETWQIIVNSLNLLYPNIRWSSGIRLDKKMFSRYDEIYGLRIQRQGNNYTLTCVDEPGWYSAHRYDNIHNGRELTTNYDETSSLFDQLNESEIKLRFGVGSRVTLSPDSRFFARGSRNPYSEYDKGTVIELRPNQSFPYRVKWDAGYTNSYQIDDLLPSFDYDETNDLFNQINESEEDFDWVPKGPNLPTNIDEDFVIVISDPKEKMDIIEMVVNYMKQLGCEIDVYFLVMIGEKLKNSNPKLIYFRRTNFKGKGIGLAFGSNEEAYRMATHKRFIDSNTFYI